MRKIERAWFSIVYYIEKEAKEERNVVTEFCYYFTWESLSQLFDSLVTK